jgi:hypothetical protein
MTDLLPFDEPMEPLLPRLPVSQYSDGGDPPDPSTPVVKVGPLKPVVKVSAPKRPDTYEHEKEYLSALASYKDASSCNRLTSTPRPATIK